MTRSTIEAPPSTPATTDQAALDVPWRTAHLMALLVALYAIPTALFGELFPVNNGLGDDGLAYGELTRRFSGLARSGGIDDYDAWRSLPCGLVWLGLRIIGELPATEIDLVRGFRWLAVVELVGSVYVLREIARLLRLSSSGWWLAFFALYGSWSVLKWTFYDPVLVDVSAFVLGLVIVWAFLTRSRVFLAAVTLSAAFVWQEAFYVSLALLVLPRSVVWKDDAPRARRWGGLVAILSGIVLVGILLAIDDEYSGAQAFAPQWTGPIAIGFSVAIAAAWVALGLFPVISTVLRARSARTDWRAIGLGVAVVALAIGIHKVLTRNPDPALAATRPQPYTTFIIAKINLWTSIQRPGVFLVAHAAFFGPVVLLVVACWSRIVGRARDLGLGALAVLALLTAVSVNSQSRHFIELVPLVALLAVVVVQPVLRPWHVGAFGVVTLAASKAWLPINHGSFPFPGTAYEFPRQYLSMNLGPWMSGDSYVIQGSVLLVVVAATGLAVLGRYARFRRPALHDPAHEHGGATDHD